MRWYTDDLLYDSILLVALLLPPLALVFLRFLDAPYGRFGDKWRWGKLNARTGWFLMELPATLVFWPAFVTGPHASRIVPLVVAILWGLHYTNRGFLFPYWMRVPRNSRSFSLLVVGTGMLVTSLHGYLSGFYLSRYADHLYDTQWLHDSRFVWGLLFFIAGVVINVHSDAVLRTLRTPQEIARGEKVYRIPRGGAFHFVTSPQYLGELMIWLGFAVLTWSMAGVFILAISLANLVPRAVATHRWYRERFPDYPEDRKALVPLLF